MENKTEAVIGIAAAVLGANWLAATVIGYPFLYCWGGYIAAPLYQSWGLFFLYITAGFIVLSLFRKRLGGFLIGIGVFVGIVELPRFMDMVFRLGGSCG
jgi:hypothetical protein